MKKKAKADVIQSTMRLPRPLWEILNSIAADARLSMAQSVERAIAQYCQRHGTRKENLLIHKHYASLLDSSPENRHHGLIPATKEERARLLKKYGQKKGRK